MPAKMTPRPVMEAFMWLKKQGWEWGFENAEGVVTCRKVMPHRTQYLQIFPDGTISF